VQKHAFKVISVIKELHIFCMKNILSLLLLKVNMFFFSDLSTFKSELYTLDFSLFEVCYNTVTMETRVKNSVANTIIV
jgi:hypothetical protein